MIFCTVGSDPYMRLMVMNAKSIKRLHPESEYIVGDIGLSQESRKSLEDLSCEIVPLAVKKDNPMGNKTGHGKEAADMFKFATFTKTILVSKLLARYDSIVFLDADAVLVRPLDFPMRKDATVTVRDETKFGRINSGVFWMSSHDMAIDWIQANVYRLITTDDTVGEQRALLDVAEIYNVDEVRCEQYNYTRIEDGVPDDVRVVHMKTWRWTKSDLVDKLEREVKRIYEALNN